MASRTLLRTETNLVGTIVNLSVTTIATTIYATFLDSKTGAARTPQASTNCFVIDKDTENFEIIETTSHSTTGGVTTLTVLATYGRALPTYGGGQGSATGKAHALGAEIGCVDIHNPVEHLNLIMAGTNSTTGTNLRIGDGTDQTISIYAENADVNKPRLFYDATTSKWYVSNDGTTSYDIAAGGSGVTAGDGIDITLGVVALDIQANCGLVITAGELDLNVRANYGLLADANGLYIDIMANSGLQFTGGQLDTMLVVGGGLAKGATGLSRTALTTPMTTGEAINGSVTPQCVCMGGNRLLTLNYSGSLTFAGAVVAFGNAAATVARASQFTTPDIAGTITLTSMFVGGYYTGGPADDLDFEVWDDNSNVPNAIIANGQFALRPIRDAWGQAASGTCYTSFTPTTPPTLTRNTAYWIVAKRSGASDAAHYPSICIGGSEARYATYDGGAMGWTVTAGQGFGGTINLSVTGDKGNLYLADANAGYLADVVGFTTSNVGAAGTAYVQTTDPIAITGLTAGSDYYLDVTAGTISAAPAFASGVAMVPVGKALTTGLLDVRLGMKRWFYTTGLIRFYSGAGNCLDRPSLSYNLECGFKPKKIKAMLNIDDSTANEDADTTNNYLGIQTLVWSDKSLTLLDTTHRTVQSIVTTGTSAVASADCTFALSSINDTGFTFAVSLAQGGSCMVYIYFEVEG